MATVRKYRSASSVPKIQMGQVSNLCWEQSGSSRSFVSAWTDRSPPPSASCTNYSTDAPWYAIYMQHPTPYTLHPTPYTLHPTPYTLHPTPYTLHPTPKIRDSAVQRKPRTLKSHELVHRRALVNPKLEIRNPKTLDSAQAEP
jgi:hypothetical protein